LSEVLESSVPRIRATFPSKRPSLEEINRHLPDHGDHSL